MADYLCPNSQLTVEDQKEVFQIRSMTNPLPSNRRDPILCSTGCGLMMENLHIYLCPVLNHEHRGDLNKTRRYGPLRGPTSSSCGGLQPSAEAFFALRAKKKLIMLFWPIFGIFWCPVVTLVTFSSNLSNFERNPKKTKKIQKNKNPKISKNPKIKKKPKNPKKS